MTHSLIALLALSIVLSVHAHAPKKKSARSAPPTAPAAAPGVLPPASEEQLSASALVYIGSYVCDFSKSIKVARDTKDEGYIDVQFGKLHFVMKPVLSPTGAVRMEDVRGQMLLLQIPAKSMLLDRQSGHRVVDDCVNEKQAENRLQIASAPPPPRLGLEPVRALADSVATKAAASAASAASAAVAGVASGPAASAPPVQVSAASAASAPTDRPAPAR